MSPRWLTLFLDLPAADFGPGVAFWRQVTRSGLSAPRGATGQFATLLPATGDAYLRVQRVDDGPGGVHLDLHLDTDVEPLAGARDRAIGLGARLLRDRSDLVLLDSPGGFTFCLVGHHGESRLPDPVPDGGPNRADQLCLDVPAEGFDQESAFWAALTGWPLRAGSLPQFVSLLRPSGIPVRLLLQRRDESAPGERVTGHLDLACRDRAAVAERHERAGARVTGRFEHWTTMLDPVGRRYCLTGRDPVSGTL